MRLGRERPRKSGTAKFGVNYGGGFNEAGARTPQKESRCGAVFTWVMGMENVPSLVERTVKEFDVHPVLLLLTLNLVMLILGMFVDPTAAIILFVPILGAMAQAAGVDPVHFGAIAILNLNIGLLTPPLGVCLFAAERIAGCGLAALLREAWPFLTVSLVALALVTCLPQLSLWLPRAIGL